MKKKYWKMNLPKRFLSLLLVAVMLVGYFPATAEAESTVVPGTVDTVADPQTLTRPETIYGDDTVNAGKVTVGKSVNDGAVSIPYKVDTAGEEQSMGFTPATNNFIVTMSQSAQVMGLTSQMNAPVDVVFVLDTSGSMETNNRDQNMVNAANAAIKTLMESNDYNRVGVVAFSAKTNQRHSAAAEILSNLAHYDGTAASSHLSLTNSSIYGQISNESRSVTGGTNIQAGIALGAKMLTTADPKVVINGKTLTRMPFLIILSDGQPTFSLTTDTWYNESTVDLVSENGSGNQPYPGNGFMAALTAAYYKGKISEHYYGANANEENRCYVYTLGVQLNTLSGSNRDLAELTMDPKAYLNDAGNDYSDDFRNYWSTYTQDKAITVTVNGSSTNYRNNPYTDTISKNTVLATKDYVNGISSTGKQMYTGGITYNDGYYNASNTSDIAGIFDTVISEINKKAISSPTHVTVGGDHNFEGYVTFTDPIGEYMEVKRIHGILADGNLYQGATFAKLLYEGTDTSFNNILKSVLATRMSITGAQAIDLDAFLASARASENQANWTSNANFDNSIVWWGSGYESANGDEHVQLLGHADNDTVEYIESQKNSDGNITVNGVTADYVCRSYFYYGTAGGTVAGENEYMYFMVRVQRELVEPYKETVVISIPASLLSVTEVLINEATENGTTSYSAKVDHEYPTRVIYEVGLRGDINAQNVDGVVSDSYRAEKPGDSTSSVNFDATTGTYYFYTNDWDRTESLASHHRAEAKATFDAASDNAFYTYQEDTLLLNQDGTPYTGSVVAGQTLYYQRPFYSWNTGKPNSDGSYPAELGYAQIKVTVPDDISDGSVFQEDGKWYIAKGVYTAATLEVVGDDTVKSSNATGTSAIVSHAHRTGSSSNSHYTVLLGNNGKLSLVRETAKTVSINTSTTNDNGKVVMVGDTLTYKIKVTNNDTQTVKAVVKDSVPAGTVFVENSNAVVDQDGKTVSADFSNTSGTLTWSDISLAAGKSVYVSFQVKVTEDALTGKDDVVNIENTAKIKLGNNPEYSTNTVTNPPEGKMVVDAEGDKIEGSVKVGDVLGYMIRVQNDAVDANGTPVKADFVVTDKIPDGTTFFKAEGGVYDEATRTITWNFSLAANASKVLYFEVYVDASAKIDASAEVQPETGTILIRNEAKIQIGNNVTRVTNKTTTNAAVGDISVKKTVSTTANNADKAFTVILSEAEGKLNGTYVLEGSSDTEQTTVEFTDGKAKVTIKHDETLVIKGLPQGAVISITEDLTESKDPGWSDEYTAERVVVSGTTGGTTVDVGITNTYNAKPVAFQLSATKVLVGKDLPAGTTFSFNAKQCDDKGNITNGGDSLSGNVTMSSAGTAVFNLSTRTFYAETNDYLYYLISEDALDIPGLYTDTKQYLVRLLVTDNTAAGQLVATADYKIFGSNDDWATLDWQNKNDQIVFTNEYPSDVKVTIPGTKELTGRYIGANEFSFRLKDANGDVIANAIASGNGTGAEGAFKFDLTYTAADMVENGEVKTERKFTYYIEEVVNNLTGVTYDKDYFKVVVTVKRGTDENAGKLVASYEISKYAYDEASNAHTGVPADKVKFENEFTSDGVSVNLTTTKTLVVNDPLHTAGLVENAFSFGVFRADKDYNYDEIEDLIVGGTNTGDADATDGYVGTVAFGSLNYSHAFFQQNRDKDADNNLLNTMTRYYVVKEIVPAVDAMTYDPNMLYSTTEQKVKVVVTYDETSGTMSAEVFVNDVKVEPNATTGKYAVTGFTNTLQADRIAYQPVGTKTTTPAEGRTLPGGLTFSFKVMGLTLDSEGNFTEGAEEGTGISTPTGETGNGITFTKLVFTDAELGNAEFRDFYFRIQESNAGSSANGITYDASCYLLKVTLSRDSEKKLQVAAEYLKLKENGDKAKLADYETASEPSFKNVYDAKAELNLTASKSYTGTLKAGDFDFLLHRIGADGKLTGNQVAGTNGDPDANGTAEVSFATLYFTNGMFATANYSVPAVPAVNDPEHPENNTEGAPAKYYLYYLMSELEPHDAKIPGVTYEKDQYVVVVELYEEGTELKANLYTVMTAPAPAEGVYSVTFPVTEAMGGWDTEITFENGYNPTQPATVTIVASKELTGRDLENGEFTFNLYRVDTKGTEDIEDDVEHLAASGKNDAGGNISITRTYNTAVLGMAGFVNDRYQVLYHLKEVDPDQGGVTLVSGEYWIVVTIVHTESSASYHVDSVAYYSNRALTEQVAVVNPEAQDAADQQTTAQGVVKFVNKYEPTSTSFSPKAVKSLLDKDDKELSISDNQFSFQVVELHKDTQNNTYTPGNVVSTGDSLATAVEGFNVVFTPIGYSGKGTHYYLIREVKGTDATVTYDTTVYYLKVVISDDNQGNLTVAHQYYTDNSFSEEKETNTVAFVNHYGSGLINIDLRLKKTVEVYDGNNQMTEYVYPLTDSQFDFHVHQILDNNQEKFVAHGTNDASGLITFTSIPITRADIYGSAADISTERKSKTFMFVVDEVTQQVGGSQNGITSDSKKIAVSVEVTDDGYGNLTVSEPTYRKYDPQDPDNYTLSDTFVNRYDLKKVAFAPSAFKTLINKDLTANEFTFLLLDENQEQVQSKGNAIDGIVTFDELTFVRPGTYVYFVKEADKGGNYDCDKSVFKIQITVTADINGQLHAVPLYFKENIDPDTQEVTYSEVGGIAFTNSYTPSGIEKNLDAQIGAVKQIVDVDGKVLSGKELSGFTFRVTNANGDAVTDKLGNEIFGESGSDGKITFKTNASDSAQFWFPAEGEYHYYITETGEKSGYVMDASVWAVHINVRYNKTTGELYIEDAEVTTHLKSEISQQDDGETTQNNTQPVFSNVYDPEDADIVLKAKKVLSGRALKDGEFTFRLMRKDAQGNYSIIVSETTNDVDGNVNFHITYRISDMVDADGRTVSERTFRYEIHEEVPAGGVQNGVTFDSGKKYIDITVKDENGILNAYVGGEKISTSVQTSAKFSNSYSASDVDVPVGATKVLTGGDISNMKFTFELVDSTGAVIQTETNDAEGKITFKPLNFKLADLGGEAQKEFIYTIREKKGTLAAVTYDDTVYVVLITVTDDQMGKLSYTVEYTAEGAYASPVFHNAFDSSVNDTQATISAKKTLAGKNLTADAFTFELVDAAGAVITATNDAQGNVNFTLPYTTAGTYTYTLREKAGTDQAMDYDTNTYKVDVVVSAGNDGRLNAEVKYHTTDGKMPEFKNIYTPAAVRVTLTGTKKLTGATMKAEQFKFQVHDSENKLVATGTNTADGKIVFSDITFSKTGKFELTVSEVNSGVKGMTYDTAKLKVTVEVTNKNGVLEAKVTEPKDGITFKNTYVEPETEPTTEPTTKPTTEPTTEPTTKPTTEPTTKPTTEPTTKPTTKPTEDKKPATDSPNTGDDMPLAFLITVMVISAVAIVVLILMIRGPKKGKYSR